MDGRGNDAAPVAHHHQPAMASIGRSEDEYITIRQKIDDNMQALTGAFHAGSGGLGVDSFLCGKVTPGQWAASARS